MDMYFTSTLYMTVGEFDDSTNQFKEAVQEALGSAVSLGDVLVTDTAPSASRLAKSGTVVVTTRVELKAGNSTKGTSSTPGLTFSDLKAALISKNVTRVPTASSDLPSGWISRFDSDLFPDTGSLLDLEITRFHATQDCYAGKYKGNNGTCTACASGKYSSSRNEAGCTDCSAGKYSAKVGSTECTDCPAGKHSTLAGSTSCTDCPAGKFKAVNGTGACVDCPAGQYALFGSTFCAVCPAGKFKEAAGSGACADCAAGKYKASAGSGVCADCPSGSSSPSGSDAQKECITIGTEVVKLVVSLPMSKADFTVEKQTKFKESVAKAAGNLPPAAVEIDKIETISARRRMLLAESIRVETSVKVKDKAAAESLAGTLTVDKINAELAKSGLPPATMLESPSVISNSSNDKKRLYLISGLSVGIPLLVICFAAAAYMIFMRQEGDSKAARSPSPRSEQEPEEEQKDEDEEQRTRELPGMSLSHDAEKISETSSGFAQPQEPSSDVQEPYVGWGGLSPNSHAPGLRGDLVFSDVRGEA
jgi:hypothetical protein